jgi:hypothetical protein
MPTSTRSLYRLFTAAVLGVTVKNPHPLTKNQL